MTRARFNPAHTAYQDCLSDFKFLQVFLEKSRLVQLDGSRTFLLFPWRSKGRDQEFQTGWAKGEAVSRNQQF